MNQLSLFTSEPEKPEERYIYKVRLTNIYSRSFDDPIKYFHEEAKAIECLENWKKQTTGNSGIITSQIRTSIKRLIS